MASSPRYEEYKSLIFHPYNIMLTLLLMGVSALFLALSGSYIYTRVQNPDIPPIKLPFLFFVNTIILLASSYTIVLANKAYKADQTEFYQRCLIYTFLLSLLFLVSQIYAWKLLLTEISINDQVTGSYLYLISFVHFAHVIAGLPFLFMFYWTARKKMKKPVSVLVYFSDPEKQLKLRLLTRYWHFLDALWIYLVIFLGVSYLIS